ncbi:glycerol-3-phosphate dehydrogenase [Cohaesibacter sp. ES.047]|uniref:FAD-dependent oxidoreductase n=1 Tax=Cohaesibacter sp. ES.047 TaxID=1798205 RepID=UPI000BB7CF5C|nr:FAD-dependent oxidoreductase [Cohaesibacter sp. ES.047]SNY90174.1 glycerol-3-phosphate dehydrogenase [Cohaesibacter sp. ES.047]
MRSETLAKLREETPFDLLIIGGGATGCGLALDAATRGLRTAMVDRYDFAEGTSGRSTKLLHGGVRYLEAAVKKLDKAQYNLVKEALHERGAALKNAPHLSRPLPLITPLYSWFQVPYMFTGLKMYDWLSGKMNIGKSKLISAAEAKRRYPMLKSKGLKACVLYYDGQFVDTRMVVSLAMTAEREGAVVANHVEVVDLLHDESGKLTGATLRDRVTDDSWNIKAKKIINATGPFADGIRKMDHRTADPILKVSSGIHLIVDADFVPPDGGLLIPQTDDGRVLFILPWQGQALIGTTDNMTEVTDHPEVDEKDIDYLLDYVHRYFDVKLSKSDVRSSWSGIRPLVFDPDAKDTAELARDHVIIEDESGLVTISGGKWTTYRFMAEQALDKIVADGSYPAAKPCSTHDMKILGADNYSESTVNELVDSYGLPADVADHLNHNYGDRSTEVAKLAKEKGLDARLCSRYGVIEAEVLYTIEKEATVHAMDFLVRRTTLALIDKAAAEEALPRVIELMAEALGWDDVRKATEVSIAKERFAKAL